MDVESTTKTAAFKTLFAANKACVRTVLTRMVGAQDAEDLTQITFAKAAQALPAFRGNANVSTWLHRIAVNVARDWLHSRTAHEAKMNVPLDGPSAKDFTNANAAMVDRPLTPEQEITHKDIHDCIRGEIAKLPDRYREALTLSFLAQLNDEEIANVLGITLGSAKVRLHRARQEFKKIIEARCDFYRDELSCKPSSPDCCAPGQVAAR